MDGAAYAGGASNPAAYRYASSDWNYTNCGIGFRVALFIKEGKVKSDDVESEYAFEYTGSMQEWNVQENGIYKLEVWGAQGGSVSKNIGFNGAYAVSYVTLNKDTNLQILVGGQGDLGSGGGGTFVTLKDNTPLAIAGGGGGAGGPTTRKYSN